MKRKMVPYKVWWTRKNKQESNSRNTSPKSHQSTPKLQFFTKIFITQEPSKNTLEISTRKPSQKLPNKIFTKLPKEP